MFSIHFSIQFKSPYSRFKSLEMTGITICIRTIHLSPRYGVQRNNVVSRGQPAQFLAINSAKDQKRFPNRSAKLRSQE